MTLRRPSTTVGALAMALSAGCAGTAPPSATPPDEVVLVGPLERSEIEAAAPDWVAAQVESEIDREAAARLQRLGGGAEITVYLGTWCSDSRRELGRLWRALDEFGGGAPFRLVYVGVDRDKTRPPAAPEAGVLYLPTFVVAVDGGEVGRVVESAPEGIEGELAALLAGEKHGLVTGRDDLGEDG